jgi:ubiquinone/menaquinone biosynthesis C-methylase UbiE
MSVDASGRASLAATFGAPGVASAYEHRPPYPTEVFGLLADLVLDRPSRVLDIGAGEGALARPLAERVDHVDAVDVSAAMVAAGRRRPGGSRSNLRWVVGAVETCDLHGPYALVTAGASLHWMDWKATLGRLRAVMTAGAALAVVEHGPAALPWGTDLVEVSRRHSRARDYDPGFSVVDALAGRRLLDVHGRRETRPVPFRQPVESYIEQFHSTASLARELMLEEEWRLFDASVAEVVGPWAEDGVLDMQIVATVAWGRPG